MLTKVFVLFSPFSLHPLPNISLFLLLCSLFYLSITPFILFFYPPFSCLIVSFPIPSIHFPVTVMTNSVFSLPLFSNPPFFLIISLSSTNLSFYHVPTPSPSSTHLFSLSSRWMIDHCLAEPWLNVHMDLHPDTHTYLVGKFCPSLLSPFVMAIIIILVSNYNYSVNGK